MSRWMLQQDPPDHGRLRGLVVRAFTAQRVEDMRPRIQQIVDKIIDRVEPRGHMDLIADFAFRLPVTVICEMLGIPDEHLEPFLTSSRGSGRLLDPAPLTKDEINQHNAFNLASAEYFRSLFELRRRQPRSTRIRIGSISHVPTYARCRSAAEFITAWAHSSLASKARLRSGRCCAACLTCGLTTPIIPTGAGPLSCAG